MKKTGLGKNPLAWIKPTIEKKEEKKEKKEEERIPKFQTFEVRLTTLLREDQLEFLEKLVREIKKNRTAPYRKERITKNTLIRVFIDAFMHTKIDTRNIPDEETLLSRVMEKIKK
ncbi:MAG TPA: hypothetical protein ENF61_00585 [Firmicutes bacterium]|nr:MAG: hypothetical protein DRP67_00820 [Candidatus Omnitrophota bacterium]HDD64593.1 hypothetical protein [Bacillota bacterium]